MRPVRPTGVAARTLTLLVAAQLILGACTSSGGSTSAPASTPQAPPSGTSGPLAWGACTDTKNWDHVGVDAARMADLDVRCGVLNVPRDHANPGDGALGMAVVQVRSTRQHDRLGACRADCQLWPVLAIGSVGRACARCCRKVVGALPRRGFGLRVEAR